MDGFNRAHLFRFFGVFVFFVIATLFALFQLRAGLVYSKDGIYEKITIYEGEYDGRPARFFMQDRSNSGAMFLDSDDPTDLVYEYTKYYSVYKFFDHDPQSILVLGGGVYSIPRAFLADLPEAIIDVSEVEPFLYDLAKEYFGLKDDSRLNNYIVDGRRLLQISDKKFDLIFGDAYYSLFSVPAHFVTEEFFLLAKERLSDGGMFVGNFIGSLSDEGLSLTLSEIKTFRKVFPNSYFFAVDTEREGIRNIIFLGLKGDVEINLGVLNDDESELGFIRGKVVDVDTLDLSDQLVLTDNFSPVEYLTAKAIRDAKKNKF